MLGMNQFPFWMRRLNKLWLLLILIGFLSGCAHHYATENYADPYGFFFGIWHGIIFPFALIANIVSWILSIFNIDFLSSVQIIGRPNTGWPYYVGFVFGLILDSDGVVKTHDREPPAQNNANP